MMNALSFPLAPTPAPGASATLASSNDGSKPGGDAFKQLLDDNNRVPSQANDKGITDKSRPAPPQRASGTADEAAASEETVGKSTETAIQSSSDTANTGSDDDSSIIDAPWPPPGLSMIAQAATPAVAPEASTQLAASLPMQAPLPMQTPAQPAESMAPAPVPLPAPATTPAPSLPSALANGITMPATPVSEAMPASEEAAPTIETVASLPTGTPINTTDDGDAAAPPPSFVHLLQGVAAPAVRVEPTPFTGALAAPVATNAPDFDEAIGARIGWLADQKIGHAHIRVTPNDMGPVEVRLQLDGDRVHASFTSAHADVRQALENSLPKLREMLGEQGLELTHADVSQHSDPRTNDGNAQAGGNGGNGGDAEPGATTAETHTPHTLRLRGLLDTYA